MRTMFTLLKPLLAVFLIVLSKALILAQNPTQTVRGKIMDEDSRSPLPGATITVSDQNHLGASTDEDGNFRIGNIPVGRISLVITYIGYEDKVIPGVLVTSGKETVLDIYLKEALIMMEALEITSDEDKSRLANEMAITSARGFTVEETRRYAGSFNDPARMVSAYAGVDTDPAGDNFIIVRGNSPKGIQWRLEGIDIPNPNHFSEEGATGGPINALNSEMLANSEFYTGAFAPEYGNALSGVFDMKLRKGNNEQREYSVSLGALGTEATLEGPFSKAGGASYLINYRYSTLTLLNNLGLVDFGGIPKYQDLSFKFFVPTRSLGTFSIFGLGGKSNIREEEFAEADDDKLLERGDFNADMGVVGITQYWSLNENTFLQNSLAVSGNGSGYLEYIPLQEGGLKQVDDFSLRKNSARAASTLHHKFNARHTVQGGVIFTRHNFDFYSHYHNEASDAFITEQNMKGDAEQYQAFVSWKFRPAENVSIVSGLHSQKTSMNDEVSIEPRASVRWQFHPTQAFTAGFGQHGKMESLTNYYAIVRGEDGSTSMPNKTIGFSKARHYVAGYENKLSTNLFLKAEAYYQHLYNIPVEDSSNSSYSLINQMDGFTDRKLVNEGTGRNVGLELTIERYFADDYYFLATASAFDSRYKAMDGIERDTQFNGHFVGNVLFGKEFRLKTRKEKNKVVGISAKFSSLGPRRFTPINLSESIATDRTVTYEDLAFSQKGDNVFIANLSISYRIDNKKISQELKVDIQNATNNKAQIGQYYDNVHNKIKIYDQLSLLPVVIYTVHF